MSFSSQIEHSPIVVNEWHRVGRGHNFDFDLSHDDVLDVLKSAALTDLAPLSLITVESIVVGGSYEWIAKMHPVEDFTGLQRKGISQFFIWSPTCHRRLVLEGNSRPAATCSLRAYPNTPAALRQM